jgi:DNA primase
VILAEGEFDAIALRQAGFLACSSTGGCRTFDPAWLRTLENLDRYVCFDNDEHGRDACARLKRLCALKEIRLPDPYKDASEYLLEHTREDFLGLIKDADKRYAYRKRGGRWRTRLTRS